MEADAWRQWSQLKLAEGIEPLGDQDLAAAFHWATRHGSANCWAGTSAEPAMIIRTLLLEIARLQA